MKGGKVEYAPKDMFSFLPVVAFIDDSRNFEEEETGKFEDNYCKYF